MTSSPPNKITGANAGGPRRLQFRALLVARIASVLSLDRTIMNVPFKCTSLLCLLVAFGCSRRPIEGMYVFRSNQVDETLDLRPGGEFRQQIKMGGDIYSATGRWSFVSRDLKFRGQFLVRFDTSKGETLKPPREYSLYSGFWDASSSRISFDVDYDAQYFVKRAP